MLLVLLFVCFASLSFFSSFWCQGMAATCACGTPWTFLFTVFARKAYVKKMKKVNTM